MISKIQTWWLSRKQRRQAKFVQDHEWVDSSDLDASDRAYEGGADSGSIASLGRHERNSHTPRRDRKIPRAE